MSVVLPGCLRKEVGEGLALGGQDVVVNLVKTVFTCEIVQIYNSCVVYTMDTSKLLLFSRHISLIFIWKTASPFSLVWVLINME